MKALTFEHQKKLFHCSPSSLKVYGTKMLLESRGNGYEFLDIKLQIECQELFHIVAIEG